MAKRDQTGKTTPQRCPRIAGQLPDIDRYSVCEKVRVGIPKQENQMLNNAFRTSKTPFDHKVVTVSGNKLTTTCNEGMEHIYTVAPDAKVVCDGQSSTTANLKAGTRVHVTTHEDDAAIATSIDSRKPRTGPKV